MYRVTVTTPNAVYEMDSHHPKYQTYLASVFRHLGKVKFGQIEVAQDQIKLSTVEVSAEQDQRVSDELMPYAQPCLAYVTVADKTSITLVSVFEWNRLATAIQKAGGFSVAGWYWKPASELETVLTGTSDVFKVAVLSEAMLDTEMLIMGESGGYFFNDIIPCPSAELHAKGKYDYSTQSYVVCS